jgi:hypothetical protein
MSPLLEADPPTAALVDAGGARALILEGRARAGIRVRGTLDLSGCPNLTELPEGLSADVLDLHDCPSLRALPPGLTVRRLDVSGCASLREWPESLVCDELRLAGTPLSALPTGVTARQSLDLSGCTALETLPAGLRLASLNLRGCRRLTALPEGLDVLFLDISGCTGLSGWPQNATVRAGRLSVAGCPWLRQLPPWLTQISQLDVSDCANLRFLSKTLKVSLWVDVAGSGLRSLPEGLRGVEIRWRGIPVEERVAFRPESITAREVLGERNAERRRVLMERMGHQRFFKESRARVLDRDRDAGGERRLLRMRIPDDEDLVCVAVVCPSTRREYLIRVPPTMRTCRQAVAWTAGFDDPDDYRPIAEA